MNKDHSCKKRTNILITGVGGQGILLASELIAKTALKANINVVCSEVHGMAQRGGVVESTVRLGDVKSPLIPLGQADVILAFEPVEAARFIHYANPETFIVMSRNPIEPFTCAIGEAKYPEINSLIDSIRKQCKNVFAFSAIEIAEKAGSALTANVVMLGALAATGILPFDGNLIKETIKERLPEKMRDVNIRAFELGWNEVSAKH